MQQEAVEVLKRQPLALEEGKQRFAQALAHQGGELRAQDDAEAVVLDVPAHDVLGLRPEVLALAADARTSPAAGFGPITGAALQNDAGGAVAEQRRGHEHGQARIVDAQAQRAQVDGEKQHVGPWARLGHAGGTRKAGDAAAAAEPENRQPLHVGAEAQAVHETRFETGDRQPGDGVGDDDVDVGQGKARLGHRLRGNGLQQLQRVALVGRRALLPGVRREVPRHGLDGVARVDAGVGVERLEAGVLRIDFLGAKLRVFLRDHVARNGGGNRADLDSERGGDASWKRRPLIENCEHGTGQRRRKLIRTPATAEPPVSILIEIDWLAAEKETDILPDMPP